MSRICRWCSGVIVLTLSSQANAFEVSLVGFTEHIDSAERVYGGTVQLTMPLEQLLAPAPRSVGASVPPQAPLSEPVGREELTDAAVVALASSASTPASVLTQSSSPASKSPPRQSPGVPDAALPVPVRRAGAKAKKRGPAGEVQTPPPLSTRVVLALVRAAQRHQGLVNLQNSIQAGASRARTSALLPELKLRAGRNTDQTLRLAPTDAEPDRLHVSGGADLRLEAQATWRLHRLLFASEEIQLERLRQQVFVQRRKLTAEVIKFVFAWQRAQLNASLAPQQSGDRLLHRLESVEARLALDTLTGGWFSKHVPDRVLARRFLGSPH